MPSRAEKRALIRARGWRRLGGDSWTHERYGAEPFTLAAAFQAERAARASAHWVRRGNGAALVLPSIPDELPSSVKDALAIRNACAMSGRCPSCGAVGELEDDPTSELVKHLVFRHEEWCPASDSNLFGVDAA